MGDFDRFRRRITCHSAAIALAASGGLFLVRPAYGLGFGLGAVASVLNLHLMGMNVPRMIEMTARCAKGYAFRWALMRYALLGLALGLAATINGVNFVCAACGIFLAQAVLVAEHLFRASSASVEDVQWKT